MGKRKRRKSPITDDALSAVSRPHAGEQVYVTGTFDDWTKSIKLDKVGDVFEKEVTFPDKGEKIYYKVRSPFFFFFFSPQLRSYKPTLPSSFSVPRLASFDKAARSRLALTRCSRPAASHDWSSCPPASAVGCLGWTALITFESSSRRDGPTLAPPVSLPAARLSLPFIVLCAPEPVACYPRRFFFFANLLAQPIGELPWLHCGNPSSIREILARYDARRLHWPGPSPGNDFSIGALRDRERRGQGSRPAGELREPSLRAPPFVRVWIALPPH